MNIAFNKYLLTCSLLFLLAERAMCLPEIARNGQFTCTACHVSPGGGGMLTPYGRDFSAEKLSTWFIDGEQNALEGLIPSSEYYLVGGDLRWVKMKSKTNDETFDRFWRMQSDFEMGLHFGPVWLTGMMGTRPAGPMDDQSEHGHLVHRGYVARIDLWDEHISIRAGLFMPKYGLMLSDHTAFVRSVNGLGPDSEQTQAEIVYQTDSFEVTAASLVQSDMYDRKGKSESGYNLGVSGFFWGKSRLNAHILSTKLTIDTTNNLRTSMGVSGVLTATEKIYGMFEIDRISSATKGNGFTQSSEALANFYSLNFEAYKGVIPYFRYEYLDSDINALDTSTSRWGLGVNWYPRPHVQFEARSLRSIANASHSATDETDAIVHYYF